MKGYLLAEGKRLVLAVLAFLVVFAAVPGPPAGAPAGAAGGRALCAGAAVPERLVPVLWPGERRSEYKHQAEIDRLKEYRKTHTQAEFEQELQKSRGGLYYVEVKEVLRQDK